MNEKVKKQPINPGKKIVHFLMFLFAVLVEMIGLVFVIIDSIFKFFFFFLKIDRKTYFFQPVYKYVFKPSATWIRNLYPKFYTKNKNEIHDTAKGYMYLMPALILIGVFTIYPLFNTFIMSFKLNYNIMTRTYTGWGIDYYINILGITQRQVDHFHGFWQAIWQDKQGFYRPLINTFIIVFVSVPISVVLSLLIAVALNSIKKLQGVFQTIFFLPYVTNVIAIGMVFSMIFNKDFGLVNSVLAWLNDVFTHMFMTFHWNTFIIDKVFPVGINWKAAGASDFNIMLTLMIYTIWSALPFKILVFLSGIQGIDKQYYQAAQVDAAPRRKIFWRITVPMLSPFILYIVITSSIGAFKAYASVIAMFGSEAGPMGSRYTATTVVWFIFNSLNQSATPGKVAEASAGSVILFIIILIFTYIQMKVSKKRVHY